ncbi:MAG: DUF2017 family protein [Planctomycetota bacterium]|jgi:hypothetical protein
MFPRLERQPDGGIAIEDLTPPFVFILLELPGLLGPDQPDEVKRRLFPDPAEEDEIRKDWARLVHPELYALLASAREIVRKDLGKLLPSGGTCRLEIPAPHVNAWISALNAARLALGAIQGIEDEDDLHPFDDPEEDDDDREEVVELDARRLAVAKIHLLGELQALLVLEQDPEAGGAGREAGTGDQG